MEVGDHASNILIKAELSRINAPTSVERFTQKAIREVLSKQKLTYVAKRYFEGILTAKTKHYLYQRYCYPKLEKTYEDYCKIKTHLKGFDQSLRERIGLVLQHFSEVNTIDDYVADTPFPESFYTSETSIVLYKDFNEAFDQDDNIIDSLAFIIKGLDVAKFQQTCWKMGTLCQHYSQKDYCYVVFYRHCYLPSPPFLGFLDSQ
jgi:hypothetical protein